MITIRPLHPQEIPAARRMIITVAHGVFGGERTLEQSLCCFEASGKFEDLDDVQSPYIQNGGQFLAALEGE